MRTSTPLRSTSLAAAGLLGTLCAITLSTGVSQQRFEWAAAPDVYAAALAHDAAWLRAIVAVDDCFVAAYVAATIFLATTLARGRWQPLHVCMAAGGVAAGLLDLHENHQLLTMLRWVELRMPLDAERILSRSDLSQLKWLVGHVTFVLVGLALPPTKNAAQRAFRASLLFVQLPIGVLGWCVASETATQALLWLRYGAFLSGFALIAWLAPRDGAAIATGAPA
jgi:hypothetical protein